MKALKITLITFLLCISACSNEDLTVRSLYCNDKFVMEVRGLIFFESDSMLYSSKNYKQTYRMKHGDKCIVYIEKEQDTGSNP